MLEQAGLLARWRNHLYQKSWNRRACKARWRKHSYEKMTRDCSPAPVRGSAGIIVRRPRSTKFPI